KEGARKPHCCVIYMYETTAGGRTPMLKAFPIAILVLIFPTALLGSAQTGNPTDDLVDLKAYIYNQDLNVTFTTKDGRSFPIKIHPKIVLELEPAPTLAGKTVDLELSIFDRENKKLFEAHQDKLPVKPNSFSLEFKLPQKLDSAKYAVVTVHPDN